MAQNLKAEALGDKKATQAMLEAEEKDGTRAKPVYGFGVVPRHGSR